MTATTDLRDALGAALAAALVDVPVSLTIPRPIALPFVRVQRIGGASLVAGNGPAMPDRLILVSVHCWAATLTEAEVLAERVRTALHDLPTLAAWCGVVREQGAPALVWDDTRPEHPIPRFVISATVTHRE